MQKTLLAAAAIAALAGPAFAQDYPTTPIVVVNPNSAGGGTDVGIRTWQPYVEACLGNGATLVPTAMPGAAGAIGNTALATAAPDGYTVGSANMPNLVSNWLARPELPKLEDLVYLGSIVGVRSTLNVRSDSPYQTFEEALAYINSASGLINVAMGGIGADDHLVGLQLEKALGVDLNFIPFGSGNDSRNALLGGQVEFAMMSNTESANFGEDVRALAIAAVERSDILPDTPTLGELGYEIVGGSDHVMAAPAGTPEVAVEAWRRCLAEAAANPEFLADAAERSLSLNIMSADEATEFVYAQREILQELWDAEPWVGQ
jgi:tripartite-type tricarboxylate transporter receptor subunit TctC